MGKFIQSRLLLASLLLLHSASGQTVLNWTANGNGADWGYVTIFGFSNWGSGLFSYPIPDSTDERANFGSGISGTLNVNVGGTIGAPYDINGVTINTGNSATLNFSNAGRINLAGNTATRVISLAGSNTANFNGEIGIDSTATITQGSSGALNFNNLVDVNAGLNVTHTSGTLSFSNMTLASTLTFTPSSGRTTNITGTLATDGAATITKNGAGTVTITGAGALDINNATTINHTAGNLNLNGAVLLSQVLTLNPSAGRTTNIGGTVTADGVGAGLTHTGAGNLSITGGINVANPLTFTHTGSGATSISGAVTLSAAMTVNDSSSGGMTFSNTISGAHAFTKSGTGALSFAMGAGGVNVSQINLTGGTLLLGANNQVTNTTALNLAGGALNTNGFDSSMGALTLNGSSTIDLGAGGSVASFSSGSRTSGVLTIANWSGDMNGGGSDQIIISSSVSSSFLSNVFWSDLGVYGARQLVSGEIVPIPEPSTYAIGGALGLLIALAEVRRRRRRGIHFRSHLSGR